MKNKQGKKTTPPGDQADKPQAPRMEEQEQKREKTFPGYPTYPAEEDIMNQGEKEDLDVEKLTRSDRGHQKRKEAAAPDEEAELDVPGAELDNEGESIGEEDEENNFYSLGGDRHENLEEDPS